MLTGYMQLHYYRQARRVQEKNRSRPRKNAGTARHRGVDDPGKEREEGARGAPVFRRHRDHLRD